MATVNNIIFDNLSEFEADFKESYLNKVYSFDSLVERIKGQISEVDTFVGDCFEYVFFRDIPSENGPIHCQVHFDCRCAYEFEEQNTLRVRYTGCME